MWLPLFVTEARKHDGKRYPGRTLYNLCAAIQRAVREDRLPKDGHPLDIYSDQSFNFFRKVLDSEMKDLQVAGIGVKPKQADPTIFSEEEKLWQEGLLGDNSPCVLVDTLVFMCGLYFALCSGHEHL